MTRNESVLSRPQEFCREHGLDVPVLMAPMAGACPPALAAAVANAGGVGGCGALLMPPEQIASWVAAFGKLSSGLVQLNLWIPDPPPRRDPASEDALRRFLSTWGPEASADAGNATLPDFEAQCEALLEAHPAFISSVMGLYPGMFVERMHARGIKWLATATTVAEARLAAQAGADVIVAQGMEAGGHRGSFDAHAAERMLVGLFALLPAVVDAVSIPVVAAGGIADGRSAAAAFVLGASAVEIGTGLLRAPEAGIAKPWADAIGRTAPEDTALTRAFSGRAGRCIVNDYAAAASAPSAPAPAPYPVQRALTRQMREQALRNGDFGRLQAWAGQAAQRSRAAPATEIVRGIWEDVRRLLG
ncbi:MAG: NAD(P)H-dependent flavin oxidoreductase [Steroidobacteraceae bacterium]